MDYRVDRNKHVQVSVYVAFDGCTADALSEEEYTKLQELSAKVDPDKDAKTKDTDESEEEATPVVPPTRFPLDQYKKEVAEFCPADFELDSAISGASTLYNPLSGHYYDMGATREAKIRYLLDSWSLDIPLKHIELHGLRQLSDKTMAQIKQVPSRIIIALLAGYDKVVYNG